MTESEKQQYEDNLINQKMCLDESLTYEEKTYIVIETETYQDVILAGTRIINYPEKYTLNKFKGSSVEENHFYVKHNNSTGDYVAKWNGNTIASGTQGSWNGIPLPSNYGYYSGISYFTDNGYSFFRIHKNTDFYFENTREVEVEKTEIIENKTSNYDWCVNNGYSTKNN